MVTLPSECRKRKAQKPFISNQVQITRMYRAHLNEIANNRRYRK